MCFHPPFQHLGRLKLSIEMVLDSAHVLPTPFDKIAPRMFNFTPPGSMLLLSFLDGKVTGDRGNPVHFQLHVRMYILEGTDRVKGREEKEVREVGGRGQKGKARWREEGGRGREGRWRKGGERREARGEGGGRR